MPKLLSPARLSLVACLVGNLVGAASGCGGTSDPAPQVEAEPKNDVPQPLASNSAPIAKPSEEALAARYRSIGARLEGGEDLLGKVTFPRVVAQLKEIAEATTDPHLRANASLMLGSLHEGNHDLRSAIAYYRQARAAVPDEAETHAMLALALAQDKQYPEAIEVQQQVVERVPLDLEARLYLAEMNVKAGKKQEGEQAYAEYELVRKRLIDGLTLVNKEGGYLLPPLERVAYAAQLEPAADTGTGMALLYALKTDPDAAVRAEVAQVMGTQRLLGYRHLLEEMAVKEEATKTKEIMAWALSEIAREGVETRPGKAPGAAGSAEPAADKDAPGKHALGKNAADKDAPGKHGARTEPAAQKRGTEKDKPSADPARPREQ